MHEELFEDLAGDVAVERTITLPAAPGLVWDHLTDGELVGEWMGGEVMINAHPGGTITMTPEDGDEIWGTIEEVVPGRRLQWSWRTDEGLPTQVEIELELVDDGTALTVRETLLPWTITGLPPQWAGSTIPGDFLHAAA